MAKIPTPPKHLKADTKRWFTQLVKTYVLESHHVRILVLACQAWDRAEEARQALAEDGLTITDRFGQLRTHPAVAIERDSRTAFARLVRELGLDAVPAPDTPRPPVLQY